MTASLEERIARVLVASTHPGLPDRKVDELVRYGVGRATARLVLAEVQVDSVTAEQLGDILSDSMVSTVAQVLTDAASHVEEMASAIERRMPGLTGAAVAAGLRDAALFLEDLAAGKVPAA